MSSRPTGLQWGLIDRLENIDFTDDLCLMFQTLADIKGKMEDLYNNGAKIGLKINFENQCREQPELNNKIIDQVEINF